MKKSRTFEELIKSTEDLAMQLESGELSLDESLSAYKQGVANLASCSKLLSLAEEQVKVLVKKSDTFKLTDLDSDLESDLDTDLNSIFNSDIISDDSSLFDSDLNLDFDEKNHS